MKLINEAHAGTKTHVFGHDLEVDKKGVIEIPECETEKEKKEVLKRLKTAGFLPLKKGQKAAPEEKDSKDSKDSKPGKNSKLDGEEKPKFLRNKGK